ncbi:hypothetical protein F5X71_32795 [Nocardia brasiliensis]|uniref:Uncharacterized protein n=1 Tax=Nocardia brasiliensis TaxID=37326 RepID=A0A6G9XZY5_NOCBR|nr:hypothetical protein [Nocardia brasiliensis]QIS06446.1 hypothetical protein F5X71_32795 [Nocardia brasiliensis]
MRGWIAVLVGELGLAVLLLVAAVASWRAGIRTSTFAALDRAPEFVATRYVGPWLLLAAVLGAVAGLFLIDAVARLVRRRRAR